MKPVRVAEVGAALVLALMWVSAPLVYWLGPERLPVHFGWTGAPDRWAPAASIFLMPLVGTFIWGLLSFARRHPNLGKGWMSEQDKARNARLSEVLLPWLRLPLVLVLGYCQWAIVATGMDWANGLNPWVMLALVGSIVATALYHIVRIWRDRGDSAV